MSNRFRSTSLRPARRSILACGIAVTLGIGAIPANAQFGLLGSGLVFDPTNFARNVLHYARRLEQMDMERRQLQAELVAMQKLRNPSWRQIAGTLDQVDALMAQGQSLAYTLRSIDAEFQRTFPGGQAFRDYPTEERTQMVRTLATLRGALVAANRAAQDLPTAVARLQAMKQQLGGIQGQEGALELNGTIGVYSAEELTMLRQSIAALTNVQAVYYADQVNAEAQTRTTYRAHLAAMSAPGPRYPLQSLRITP